ncbi:MAG: glycerol-3-phosphate acyltransferase, partial [Dehalococcoidales bacterium]|nr:glycerol-3-phosphate acyltransferase [Dehalococcoidales bacterium]
MIGNDVITGIIAIIIGYLLGSIPPAYVITRLVTGKDIRKIGGGNVGARNVFVEVGKAAGIGVGVFDVLKGAGAVALASWLLEWPQPWSTDV